MEYYMKKYEHTYFIFIYIQYGTIIAYPTAISFSCEYKKITAQKNGGEK